MAVHKALPVAYFPVASYRNEYNYSFLPGKLRANAPAPKVKNPIILEADAVILDNKSPDWVATDESKSFPRINTAGSDPSLDAAFQIPIFLRQTFLEAYRRQADPRSELPSKGEWVNLTA